MYLVEKNYPKYIAFVRTMGYTIDSYNKQGDPYGKISEPLCTY